MWHSIKTKLWLRKLLSFALISGLFLNFYLIDLDPVNFLAQISTLKEEQDYKFAKTQAPRKYLTFKEYDDTPANRITDLSYCFYEDQEIDNETSEAKDENEDFSPEGADTTIPRYQGELVKTTMSNRISPDEMFRVNIYVKNTGKTRWYSDRSGCPNQPPVRLGTKRPQDRQSIFWTNYQMENGGWVLSNTKDRIEMMQDYIDPDEVAIFMFWSKAPEKAGLYREYFKPVVEGVQWFENTPDFFIDVPVGFVFQEDYEKMKHVTVTSNSNDVINAEKIIEVDLSEQKLFMKYGDFVINTFPISSGAKKTPTPPGEFEIRFKQEVRVATKWPHYIMPKFQGFARPGSIWLGYGFHALPSLGSDGGAFWTEALNHIGIPVSHGCIRLLKEDAQTLYAWTDEGIKVEIHQ